jgi:hypothetical protein
MHKFSLSYTHIKTRTVVTDLGVAPVYTIVLYRIAIGAGQIL